MHLLNVYQRKIFEEFFDQLLESVKNSIVTFFDKKNVKNGIF